jgi:hypothetical protein
LALAICHLPPPSRPPYDRDSMTQPPDPQWRADLVDLADRLLTTRPLKDDTRSRLVGVLVDVFTMREIAEMLGVSIQAVSSRLPESKREDVRSRQAERSAQARRPPAYSLPTRNDVRHVRDLVSLGFVADEAVQLVLGPAWTGRSFRLFLRSRNLPTLGSPHKGKPLPYGRWSKSWHTAFDIIEIELKRLIAWSALRKGATFAEVGEIVGLPPSTISSWKSHLPSSVSRTPN